MQKPKLTRRRKPVKLLKRTHDFWESYRRGEVALDPNARSRQRSGSVRLPAEAGRWDRKLARARIELAKAQVAIQVYESLLLTAMGEARVAVLPSGVSYEVRHTPVAAHRVKKQVRVSLKRHEAP